MDKQASHLPQGQITLLGDDLYAHQPFCERALDLDFHFILVCKEESHQTLYEWLAFLDKDIEQLEVRHFNGRFMEKRVYRFVDEVPLRQGDDALMVNWLEITILDPKTDKRLYHNAFVTDHLLSETNIPAIAQAGRSRWKIENENNNVLKKSGVPS